MIGVRHHSSPHNDITSFKLQASLSPYTLELGVVYNVCNLLFTRNGGGSIYRFEKPQLGLSLINLIMENHRLWIFYFEMRVGLFLSLESHGCGLKVRELLKMRGECDVEV